MREITLAAVVSLTLIAVLFTTGTVFTTLATEIAYLVRILARGA